MLDRGVPTPVTYRIDAARRRIETVATGSVTHAEIVAHLDREQADSVLGLPECVDATRATAAFTPAEVRHLLDHLRALRGAGTLGPAAVLVADDSSFGMLRMLEILSDEVCEVRRSATGGPGRGLARP